MMKNFLYLFLLVAILFYGCSLESLDGEPSLNDGEGDNNTGQPGLLTAGEWNDLTNWEFWGSILNNQEYSNMPAYWSFFTNNRVSVQILDASLNPVIDARVDLKRNDATIFSARSDNGGQAELWVDLFQYSNSVEASSLVIDVNNGESVLTDVNLSHSGVNSITLSNAQASNRVEISFVVDATGSMGDELEFLKTELLDVIERVKDEHPNVEMYTSSVFYRDQGDEYVARISAFTSNITETINFIKDQRASGGGDYPEAVHTALDKAINELQWAYTARTRLLFLVLDAPPHYRMDVISSLQNSITSAAQKGIKLIPVTASGINKETEFLMRFFAIATNGTYVFITDDSGVGNSHLEPTVGDYEVELLNNLLVRLINKYSE
ncbi:MAG: vWA domain-containing protein [Tenuifilaceae bacterium]|jgi:hypothetical protein|nr:vWA domain-containing protein [Tenuifilaceae bacterium]